MSVRFIVIGRTAVDTDPLIGVLPGGESIRVLQSPSWLPGEQPDIVGRAVLPLLEGDCTVVLGSGQDNRDLAGWLAMRLDAPVIWSAESVRFAGDGLEVVRTTHGGRVRVVQEVDPGPAVVLARPAVGVSETGPPPYEVARFDVGGGGGVVPLSSPGEAEGPGVQLATAEVVVSVGRGIGGPESLGVFRDLAGQLGGALGASRVVVDSGWLSFAHQVGQTGASVAPSVYLAFGISGAVQHQAGMRNSQIVIAVNTDREAPLCRMANLVVEGDAVTVASALLDRVRRRSNEESSADSYL